MNIDNNYSDKNRDVNTLIDLFSIFNNNNNITSENMNHNNINHESIGITWKEMILPRIITKGESGGLLGCYYRGLFWRIYLNVLPIDGIKNNEYEKTPKYWNHIMDINRQSYEKLKKQAIPDITSALSDNNNNNNNNDNNNIAFDPLSSSPSSPSSSSIWKKHYDTIELVREIKQDLERLYPNGCEDYFINERIQSIMLDILVVWCNENPDISYRQGMHELLAPIILILEKEKEFSTVDIEILPDCLHNIFHNNYIEHDAYYIFSSLMNDMKLLYYAPKNSEESVIINLANHIQNNDLQILEPNLYNKLNHYDIQPQLYCMKWLRLIFAREFNMENVLLLWDYIFSQTFNHRISNIRKNTKFSLLLHELEYFACALLLNIKNELIESDSTTCLTYLMRYPHDTPLPLILNLTTQTYEKLNKNQQEAPNWLLNNLKLSSNNNEKKYNYNKKSNKKINKNKNQNQNQTQTHNKTSSYLNKIDTFLSNANNIMSNQIKKMNKGNNNIRPVENNNNNNNNNKRKHNIKNENNDNIFQDLNEVEEILSNKKNDKYDENNQIPTPPDSSNSNSPLVFISDDVDPLLGLKL